MHTGESTHLKADGSGRSRETSGTFVSLLSKHTLLTSRTGLSVASLGLRKETCQLFVDGVFTVYKPGMSVYCFPF